MIFWKLALIPMNFVTLIANFAGKRRQENANLILKVIDNIQEHLIFYIFKLYFKYLW